ncbi:MAG: hypothetical protein ABI612_16505 [Betaproteobacteria bacterium]
MQHKAVDENALASYLAEVLKRIDTEAKKLPKDSTLAELLEDTGASLGVLIGYLVGGDPGPTQRHRL